MEKESAYNVQDAFLNQIRRSRAAVTVFLVNGVKLQGFITWFDDEVVLLRRDEQTQLIYKHAISTVMPSIPVNISDSNTADAQADRDLSLGDEFLGIEKESSNPRGSYLAVGAFCSRAARAGCRGMVSRSRGTNSLYWAGYCWSGCILST